MTTENLLGKKTLRRRYAKLKQSVSDVLKKIEYLESVAPDNGLAVTGYPAGTSLDLLKKVATSLKDRDSFDGLHYTQIPTSHQTLFHLVRNSSPMHDSFEKKQAQTGGINSMEICDLGDFRIVRVVNGEEVEGIDFSLYKTDDAFHI